MPKIYDKYGVTLLELLIGMVLLSMVTTAGYNLYINQKEASHRHEQLVEMNQSLRAAMFYLEKDLRTAGCDPSQNAGSRILVSEATRIQFTRDVNVGSGYTGDDWYDGDTDDSNENITYAWYNSYASSDDDMDLARKSGAGNMMPVAEKIDALNFVYLGKDGNVLPYGSTTEVRSVQVTIVARSRRPIPNYTNTESYVNFQGMTILDAQNDHYLRQRMAMTVSCRNL